MTRISRRAVLLATPALLLPAAAGAAPTPSATEGPFYPDRMPRDEDSDLVLIEGAVREAGGEILHLAGRVLNAAGSPLPGVRVEIWQCDANGVYLHSGDRRRGMRDRDFQGFGHAIADSGGRYGFRTIVPVPYPGRTPHIHVKVRRQGRDMLTTQLYRAGHPQNSSDFLFQRMTPAEQTRVLMELRPRSDQGRPSFETAVDLVMG